MNTLGSKRLLVHFAVMAAPSWTAVIGAFEATERSGKEMPVSFPLAASADAAQRVCDLSGCFDLARPDIMVLGCLKLPVPQQWTGAQRIFRTFTAKFSQSIQ